jgi:hypothetical protein
MLSSAATFVTNPQGEIVSGMHEIESFVIE